MPNNLYLRNIACLAFVASVFSACATGALKETPAPLPDPLPNEVSLDVTWWHILGDVSAKKAFGQRKPVVYQDVVYVALADGKVFSVSPEGDTVLVGEHDADVTAPLAIQADQVVILDNQGRVSLTNMSLETQWQLSLGALATEPALMTPERIFVQTIDGRINAIERITGRLLWSYQDAEPRLTVTGTSTPTLIATQSGPAIVTGLANGKIVAINVVDGSVIWEYRITRASGKTDVSRLVDVDAKITVLGDRIIAAGYQGDLIVVESATGRVLQAKEFSTYRSIKVSDSAWYGVTAESHLVALDPVNLAELWRNSDLAFRQLSDIVEVDGVLAVTDTEGYLHAIDAQNGTFVGSRHIDWRGAQTDPVLFKGGVLVQGHSTRLKFVEFSR